MSSSCRNALGCLAALPLLAGAELAQAQQVYFQPQFEAGAEVDTNRNLVLSSDTVNKKQTSEGYHALANTIIGIATPQSDTTLRPQLVYSDYPQAHSNYLHSQLDLNSQYHSARTQLGLGGNFDRQSTYSSELASAEFNPVNPNLPTTPETGRVSTAFTRTLVTLVPTYSFEVTPRLSWKLDGTYQNVDFSGSNANTYTPYSYYQGGTSLTWVVTQRVNTSVGGYVSHELARDGSGSVKGTGATLGLEFKWSTQLTGQLQVNAERDDTQLVRAAQPLSASTTGAGATLGATWQGQTSKLQLSVGRTVTPSGSGGTFHADQVQVQYGRDLTQRLSLLAAGRYIHYTSLTQAYTNANYDYVTLNAGLKWRVTPVWYLSGGLEYLSEKFEAPTGTADNGMLYVAFGYKGLGRQY